MTVSKGKLCTKCKKENSTDSNYCAYCGTKLILEEKKQGARFQKHLKEASDHEEESNFITLENMHSKISGITFIAAKVIQQTSLILLRPTLPSRHSTYFTEVFVVLQGKLSSIKSTDITDEVKEKILEDLGTDLDASQIIWLGSFSISPALRDMGWNILSRGADYYLYPADGRTIKSLVTIDYDNQKPHKSIVKGETIYTQHDAQRDESFRMLGLIISVIFIVAIICFAIIFND